jgi:histidinol-phosphate aminotransferase
MTEKEVLDIFEKYFGYIIQQREYLYDELKKINGIKAYPSQANFILFECLEKEPKEVFKKLHKNGILIRDMTSYPMLSKAFRVTAGKKEDNEVFIEKLREIMES